MLTITKRTMKSFTRTSNFLRCFLFISVFSFSIGMTAQNIWKGGTPGAETEWMNPRNWSENEIPDWTDEVVIIPDVSAQTGFFPIIRNTVPEINYLAIEAGAQITIDVKGALTIDGKHTYNYGILNIGNLYNKGHLVVQNTALSPLGTKKNTIHNTGRMDIKPPREDDGKPVVATSTRASN